MQCLVLPWESPGLVGRRLRYFGELLFSLNLWTSNAGHQARREAEAERKLYAVACMPWLDRLWPTFWFPVSIHGSASIVTVPPSIA
jgi:hypothetical protein